MTDTDDATPPAAVSDDVAGLVEALGEQFADDYPDRQEIIDTYRDERAEAATLIRQQAARLAEVERERDEAWTDRDAGYLNGDSGK